MNKGAVFSDDNRFRYRLWRIWDASKPLVLFIGLNPSVADAERDDKTIARLIGYARQWDFGGFYVGNLFAFVTPKPEELRKVPAPVGIGNDEHLTDMASGCSLVVGMWGNNGTLLNRNKAVEQLFPSMHCLHQTKAGHPAHPLYLKTDLFPVVYR